MLRNGIKHGALSFNFFYGTPSADNTKAVTRHATNRFSITRQLYYSREQTKRALDLCAFINGLPLITFELKNSLTKQTVAACNFSAFLAKVCFNISPSATTGRSSTAIVPAQLSLFGQDQKLAGKLCVQLNADNH